MLESATLEPARCCSACQITEQGFLARDEMATGMCRSGWSLSSCFGLPSSDERSRQKSKGSTRQLVSLETELQFRLKPKGLRIGSKDTPHPTTMSCSVLTCSSSILSFSLSLSPEQQLTATKHECSPRLLPVPTLVPNGNCLRPRGLPPCRNAATRDGPGANKPSDRSLSYAEA